MIEVQPRGSRGQYGNAAVIVRCGAAQVDAWRRNRYFSVRRLRELDSGRHDVAKWDEQALNQQSLS
jgi:hypothetical protein